MQINLTGLASGFDWNSFITQMVEVERQPEETMRDDQTTIKQRGNAYASIQTQLEVLRNKLDVLKEPTYFGTRSSTTSDEEVATATADVGTALGQYKFTISQLATASSQKGSSNAGRSLSATNDVSSLVVGEAAFSSSVTAGTFTVNGKQVSIETSDTLQEVFDKIATATSNAVTASYDADTDKITLSSTGTVVLGSATDTSNFLEVAKLNNNNSGTVTSSAALGAVQLTGTLADANLATALEEGSGEFKINGVSFTYNSSNDSITNVLDRINNSSAGVTASYDVINDRFVLTSKSTGDIGVALEDVTGNFLAATGLSGGTLERGKDLIYTINDGGELRSHSNTISSTSSGITGLSVTVAKEGTTTINVGSDTETIKTAIKDFIEAYNSVQSLIDTNTASSTDAQGKVTAGTLAAESDATSIATELRRIFTKVASSLSGSIKSLDDLGIASNGYDDKLEISDETKLSEALANNLTDIQSLFTDSTYGLTTMLDAYMEKTVGEEGTLIAKQDVLTKQANDIDTQIADLEKTIAADKERWVAQFTAMEEAQAKMNQQLSYILKTFSSSSSSK